MQSVRWSTDETPNETLQQRRSCSACLRTSSSEKPPCVHICITIAPHQWPAVLGPRNPFAYNNMRVPRIITINNMLCKMCIRGHLVRVYAGRYVYRFSACRGVHWTRLWPMRHFTIFPDPEDEQDCEYTSAAIEFALLFLFYKTCCHFRGVVRVYAAITFLTTFSYTQCIGTARN